MALPPPGLAPVARHPPVAESASRRGGRRDECRGACTAALARRMSRGDEEAGTHDRGRLGHHQPARLADGAGRRASLDRAWSASAGILTVPPGGFPDALRRSRRPLAGGRRNAGAAVRHGRQPAGLGGGALPAPAPPARPRSPPPPSRSPSTAPISAWCPASPPRIDAGMPDVMRGEETKLVGAGRTAWMRPGARLPARHPQQMGAARKPAASRLHHPHDRRGLRRAARTHTILARTSAAGRTGRRPSPAAWPRAGKAGGLLHHLFGTRTLHLMDRLAPAETDSYLSGLLIGHEIVRRPRPARPPAPMHLAGVGGPDPALYAAGLRAFGIACTGSTTRTWPPPGCAHIGGASDETGMTLKDWLAALPPGRHPARRAPGRGVPDRRGAGRCRHRRAGGAAELARAGREHPPPRRAASASRAGRRRHGD